MNAADPLRLARLDAPSSPALARDTADLASVVASGRRYAGVALRVRSARAVQVTAARATLEAVIDTAAYQVTGGARSEVGSARPGERLRFFLVWSQGRWRVERVERPRRPAPTPAPP